MKSIVYSFAAAVALIAPGALLAQNWELQKQSGGVSVYTRSVGDSSLKEFRAVTAVEVPPEAALAMFEDTDAFCQWFDSCGEARTVRRLSAASWVNYFVSKQPVGVSDRDMYIRVQVSREASGAILVSMSGVADFAPPAPGRVRVPRLTGVWRFAQGENGGTVVTYQVHSEPGGGVPSFVANMAVTDGPFKTLLRFRQRVAQYATVKPQSL